MSITAEIIAHTNRSSGVPLSLRTGPIHRPSTNLLTVPASSSKT